jgi:hypothetical protein
MRQHLILTTNSISNPPRPARSSKSPRAPGARTPRLRQPLALRPMRRKRQARRQRCHTGSVPVAIRSPGGAILREPDLCPTRTQNDVPQRRRRSGARSGASEGGPRSRQLCTAGVHRRCDQSLRSGYTAAAVVPPGQSLPVPRGSSALVNARCNRGTTRGYGGWQAPFRGFAPFYSGFLPAPYRKGLGWEPGQNPGILLISILLAESNLTGKICSTPVIWSLFKHFWQCILAGMPGASSANVGLTKKKAGSEYRSGPQEGVPILSE